MFVPWPLDPIQANKMTIKLSPIIDTTMKPPECTYAFQIIKTALAAPGIVCQMMIDTLGAQLNLITIVDSILGDWHRHFCCNWSNFARLTILSFHDDAGKQVDNTTTAAESAILLPVQDGQVSDCRKKQIWFV
jgi:hypothetical protein